MENISKSWMGTKTETQKDLTPITPEQKELSPIEKVIAARFKQTSNSRLAEYITGLKTDDPKMVERLGYDQDIIRGKYRLPPDDMLFDAPREFERSLLDIAKKYKADIRTKSECGTFFKEVPHAGGVHFDAGEVGSNDVVGLDIERSKEIEDYMKSLRVLEHELIHVMQHSEAPTMPIELMEYEAYVGTLNVKGFQNKDPENIESILFGYYIGGSIRTHYKLENKKNGIDPKTKPKWDNPEFFLQNIDGVTAEQIESYKQKIIARN